MEKIPKLNELIMNIRKKIAPNEKVFKDKTKYKRKNKYKKQQTIDF